MNTLITVLRELTGLFIDDGSLALAIVAVVALAGISVAMVPANPIIGGIVLLLGCSGVLLANVLGAVKQ